MHADMNAEEGGVAAGTAAQTMGALCSGPDPAANDDHPAKRRRRNLGNGDNTVVVPRCDKAILPDAACATPLGLLLRAVSDKEPRADSRELARHLGVEHRNVFDLIKVHRADFELLGVLPIETAKPRAGSTGGRPERFAMLLEDQAILLLALSRNTPRVRLLKVRLVKAFGEVRRSKDLWQAEYLPTYHALHDGISHLAKGSTNERFVHMNVNKLVNRSIGVDAGQRPGLTLARRSMLIVAQATAEQAMHGATDHHDGYARAKSALTQLSASLIGIGP